MSVDFRIVALPLDRFAGELAAAAADRPAHGARWLVADASPGYPCRVSLRDAAVGERVLALSFLHHDTNSPYRASGPVFVRERAQTATPAVNEIPAMLRHRQLSLRGYDAVGMMRAAHTVAGSHVEHTIHEIFSSDAVSYIHIHNAGPGCFNCAVQRV